jgi:hypothetical protein
MWLCPIDTKRLTAVRNRHEEMLYGIFSHPDLLENMSMATVRDTVHLLVIFK